MRWILYFIAALVGIRLGAWAGVGLAFWTVIGLLIGFWGGTAVTWFAIDSPYIPIIRRVWRAVTWLPWWIFLLLSSEER